MGGLHACLFYDYDEDFANAWYAGDWLAYLLFQVEVNAAWSGQDEILFLWNHYHPSGNNPGASVRPWMAQGAVLFAFMAGARGVWHYDEEPWGGDPTDDYVPYEYAACALWQVADHGAFLGEGSVAIAGPDVVTAFDGDLPLWRGRRLGSRHLVVVQNPYAPIGTVTDVEIETDDASYGTIRVDGPYPTLVEL